MGNNMNFGIIGGDMRQIYLAKSILNDGYNIKISGFDNLKSEKALSCSLDVLINNSNYIILPTPATKDGININTPMSDKKISIQDTLLLAENKNIFSGKLSDIKNLDKLKFYDYSSREDFAILNAIPTAEAAIQIAISERVKTLYKSRCLVCGFGRIGKVLSRILTVMGTDLTVSARKASDLAWIKSLNINAINTAKIKDSGKYDVIFNTVPHKIFDESTLLRCTLPDTLIIDLASMPGGVDFEASKKHNINTIHALALPGKFTPQTAGELIKQSIYNIIKEENLYE